MRSIVWRVDGMYCPHCEQRVKQALSGLEGLQDIHVSFRTGLLSAQWDQRLLPTQTISDRLASFGYTLRPERPALKTVLLRILLLLAVLAGLFALFLWTPLSALAGAFPTAQAGMSLGAIFLVGAMTSLHCVAMCGGLNLAQSASAAQNGRPVLKPNLQYQLGRMISYTTTGAIVGAIGSALQISIQAQMAIQIAAAVFMLLMALNPLDFAGLRSLLPTLPGGLRVRLSQHGSASSLYVGLLNGLMPCGPLQTMQLYALSTGSWWMGALSMIAFGLGTVPLMLGIGAVGGAQNRRFARPMRLISGALVLVMSVSMLTNALSLGGLLIPSVSDAPGILTQASADVQYIETELDWREYPAFTVQKGIPVRWVLHAEERKLTGCNNEIVIPALNLRIPLHAGENVIEFTADSAGEIPYSCWMGMIRSTITVTE